MATVADVYEMPEGTIDQFYDDLVGEVVAASAPAAKRVAPDAPEPARPTKKRPSRAKKPAPAPAPEPAEPAEPPEEVVEVGRLPSPPPAAPAKPRARPAPRAAAGGNIYAGLAAALQQQAAVGVQQAAVIALMAEELGKNAPSGAGQ